jgi:hypothetical protein
MAVMRGDVAQTESRQVDVGQTRWQEDVELTNYARNKTLE